MTNTLLAGCGDVATALGLRLIARGHHVYGLRRNVRHLPKAFKPIAADLSDPDTLRGLPETIDHVLYAASADEGSDAAYERAYVQGLRNLLGALRGHGAGRLFFLSSTAVYAQTDGSWIDEDSATEPQRFSGLRTLEAERIARDGHLPCTVLRCSGIYGPGREQLLDRVRSGAAVASPRYTNRIHRDDVAGVVEHLIVTGSSPPRLIVSDDAPVPMAEVVGFLAKALGAPEPPTERPDAPLPARGGNKRCSNRALRATGYRLRFPSYREGYSPLLAGAAET